LVHIPNHVLPILAETVNHAAVDNSRTFGSGSQTSRFIEDGSPPSDAQVVDRTWKHPNKGGGPDRRFRDNRLLPVCLYEVMHLSSASGVNEPMEFSRTGLVQAFSTALHGLPYRQAPDSLNGSTLLLGSSTASEQKNFVLEGSSTDKSRDWTLVAAIALIAVPIAPIAVYALRGSTPASSESHEAAAVSPSVLTTTAAIQTLPTEVATKKLASASTEPTLPGRPIVTVKTPANIRGGPTSSATLIRRAGAGEKFGIFGRANGWVRVGTDKPLGWIAATLLVE
jgi:hypothetical protein